MTIDNISLVFSIISLIAAIGSTLTSIFAVKEARNSSLQTILFELLNHYNSPEMNLALTYIGKIRRENQLEFEKNPYEFARKYIKTISTESPEWNYRRKVSHFYNYLASLLQTGVVKEKLLFSLIDPVQLMIQIEFLEPIEVAISETHFQKLPKREWHILWLHRRCQDYVNKQKQKVNTSYIPPLNKKAYEQSLKDSEKHG